MNQIDQYKGRKKQWEKPQLFNLSVEADTKTGFLGPSADFTNTVTANNTVTS
ncbi:MAG: hypothetical protein PVH61_14735 [Candidatus Aminicenantes bacterium]|jgi:hypothetical protein